MVRVVGVIERMAHHETWLDLADNIDQIKFGGFVHIKRIVAAIHEHNIMGVEGLGRRLGLFAPRRLDLFKGRAVLFPQLGRFAAFAVRQADNGDIVAAPLIGRASCRERV